MPTHSPPTQQTPQRAALAVAPRGLMIVVCVVAAVAIVVGWPTRHGDFLPGDDHNLVLDHVFVNHPSFRNAWRLLTMIHGDLYQPMPMLSFQLNYALAGSDATGHFHVSPFVFHLTNILLHTMSSTLACLIAWRLSRRIEIAAITGILFACHPFAMESVAWITGRMILLSTTFSLLVILICISRPKDGNGMWPFKAGIAWLGAVLSKMLPSVPVAAAWCDYQCHRPFPRRAWKVYAALLLISALGAWLTIKSTSNVGFFEITSAESTTIAPVRGLLASRYYIENYVWPTRLCAWQPPPDRVGFFSLPTGIAIAEWAGFATILWFARHRSRLIYTGLVLFLLLIAPFLVAGIARRFLAADRYMYLPMLGLHFTVAAAFVAVFDAIKRRWSKIPGALIVGTGFLALCMAYFQVDQRQSKIWSNIVAQAHRTMELYPNDVDATYELARAYMQTKQPDEVLRIISGARQQWPNNPRLAALAGEAYRSKEDWIKAEQELAFAVEHETDIARSLYHYGLTLEKLNRPSEARKCYLRLLEQYPGLLPAVTALARNYREAGELDQAIVQFRRAIELNPHHRDSLYELALLNIELQNWTEASYLLRRIVDMSPEDRPARFHLAVVLAEQRRLPEAIRLYDQLLVDDPKDTPVRINRAHALAALGQSSEAEAVFRDILAFDPQDMRAAIGLHEVLQHGGRYADILKLWQMLAAKQKDSTNTNCYLVWALALNEKMSEAQPLATAIPVNAPLRALVDWAYVYDALRHRDFDGLASRLHSMQAADGAPKTRHELARLIIPAFADLPPDLRDSSPGRYTLARLLLYSGDVARAESTARQLASEVQQDRWSAAAEALARSIDAPNGN